jgi:uncharacterized protein (TIGR02996 family)
MEADPELSALLAACRACPADDLARLVLADYLEERNQPKRAELIRLQVELSHPSSDIEHQRHLQRRKQELTKQHGAAWLGTDRFLSFDRGMIHARFDRIPLDLQIEYLQWLNSPYGDWLESIEMRMAPDEFVQLDIPDKLNGRIDLVMDIVHLRRPNALEEFAFSSNATMLRGLQVSGSLRGWTFPPANPLDVSKLVSLVVNESEVSAANSNIVAFVAGEKFSSLTKLDLGRLTTNDLKKLCRSAHLRNLVSLNLAGSPIGDDGIEALCSSPMAETLRAVSFPNTKMGNRGLRALLKSPIITRMHGQGHCGLESLTPMNPTSGPKLNLKSNHISDEGIIALAECPHLSRFNELVLRENDIGDAGIIALAESPYVANLRFLDVWRNRITDRGAMALAASPYLVSIVDLSVKENRLTHKGVSALQNRFGNNVKW